MPGFVSLLLLPSLCCFPGLFHFTRSPDFASVAYIARFALSGRFPRPCVRAFTFLVYLLSYTHFPTPWLDYLSVACLGVFPGIEFHLDVCSKACLPSWLLTVACWPLLVRHACLPRLLACSLVCLLAAWSACLLSFRIRPSQFF